MPDSITKHRPFALCTALLALSLPFELDSPLLAIGGFQLTNVEIVLILCIGLGLASPARPTVTLPKRSTLLLAVFLTAAIIAALQQPSPIQLNALKAVLRTLLGMSLAAVIYRSMQRPEAIALVLHAVVLGALIAAALGFAEVATQTALSGLGPFRQSPSLAGPFLRLTGPFDYANQAAMSLEVASAIVMGWLVSKRGARWATTRRSRWFFACGIIGLLTLWLAIVLTFSRAAVLTIVGVIVCLALAQRWARRMPTVTLLIGALLATTAAVLFATNDVVRLRYSTISEQVWYQNALSAPVGLDGQPNERVELTVHVQNNSPRTWSSSRTFPINLGARIVNQDGQAVAEPRWPLDQPLVSGEQRAFRLALELPSAGGSYTVRWDLVEERIAWFEQMTGHAETMQLTVNGPVMTTDTHAPAVAATAVSTRPPDPSRLVLWQTAGALLRDSPAVGIGLDTYRLQYGPQLGFDVWNETLHSNNWYVETMVSAGLIGGAAFIIWLGGMSIDVLKRLADPKQRLATDEIAIGAALLAFVLHGFLDYFLLFNATGLLFWMLVGLWGVARDGVQ